MSGILDFEMASNTRKVVICSAGIFVCYFYFGILQEKITRSVYGDGDQYTYSLTLVFIQCVISAIFSQILLHTCMKQGVDSTRQIYYGSSAISYLGGMVTSNMALQYVNYPTQVVGKSCKPIPVMLLGVLIAKKRYSLAKYLFVLMIVVGVSIFIYKDKPAKAATDQDEGSILGIGEILLIMSLTMDGFTGAIQEKMRKEHKSKSCHMMFFTNIWASGFLAIAILVTGELWRFMEFAQKYPYVVTNLFTFALTSALGQLFIYLTVSEFGPLPCSIITTTRKFFTVLGSVLLFGNALIPRQWLGVICVFTGLTLDNIYGKPSGDKKENSEDKKKDSDKRQ